MSFDSDFHFYRFSMLGVTLTRVVSRICVEPWIFYLRSVRGSKVEGECFAPWKETTKHKHTLKVESALLSALLAFTGVNFHVNFHVLWFLSFLQAGSLPKSLFLSVGTFVDLPKLIQNTFGIFHENMFFEVSGVILASFWKVFWRRYLDVIFLLFDVKLLPWSRTMYLKTWALPQIFIWIDFQCLVLDWAVLFYEFALNPESSTCGQSGGARVEGECFAPWNETTKHKQYIKSRKRIAFCAPGFYRGQFLCQFSCFVFFVFSTSWKSPKVIVFECWHLRGPS